MKKVIFEWIVKNWKEIIFFLTTWTIGLTLLFRVIDKIDPKYPCEICPLHWIIFFTAIFLLLLPFVKKIEFGKIFKIENQVKETKAEIKDFKTETKDHFSILSNSINTISQNLSNNITINNNYQMGIAPIKEREQYNKSNNSEITQEINEVINNKVSNENDFQDIQNLNKKIKSFNEFTFENEILDALERFDLFNGNPINRSLKIVSKEHTLNIFDAFVRTDKMDIIIEIKLIKTVKGLKYLIDNVRKSIDILFRYNTTNNRFVNIKGLIIVLDSDFTYENTYQEKDISILKYNLEQKEFTNIQVVSNWLNI